MDTMKAGSTRSEKPKRNSKQKARAKGFAEASAGYNTLLSATRSLAPARVVLLICLFSFLAYANSLGGDFVFDDTEQIVGNQDIRSWENLGRAFTTHVWAFRDRPEALRVPVPPPYYRPLFTVLFTVGYHLFGLWPQGWHLLSLLFHIACSAGVFYLIRQFSNQKGAATVAALLFAVYPIHVESVSWISGITDPLFGVFFIASLHYYFKFRSTGSRSHLAFSLFMFALSAFSKETALSLVALIFVCEAFRLYPEQADRRRDPRQDLPEGAARLASAALRVLPYLAVAAVYLTARFLVLGGLTWKNPHAYAGPLTHTLLTLPWVIITYLIHLALPFDLSIAYNTSFVTTAYSPRFIFPALALAAIVWTLIAYRKKIGKQVWFALALIFVPLLPVLDLRQLSVEYLIFDRYLYLSAAGWCFLIALCLERLSQIESQPAQPSALRRIGIASALMVVLVLLMTAATARENLSWADSHALWSNAARIRPGFWAAHYNEGLALIEAKKYSEAIEALKRAALVAPDEPFIFDAMGRAYDGMGEATSAVENFKRALVLEPTMFESVNNLGTVYFKMGDYRAAEQNFKASLVMKPQAVASRFNLALCYSRLGQYSEAIGELNRALERAPDDAEILYELGLNYEKARRKSEAEGALRRAYSLAKSQALADKINEALQRTQ
jgi:protein O-mannosyl-transferase